MPHWVVWLAIVVVAWMVLAVVGGWLIGRGLGVIGRRSDLDAQLEEKSQVDLRRAA